MEEWVGRKRMSMLSLHIHCRARFVCTAHATSYLVMSECVRIRRRMRNPAAPRLCGLLFPASATNWNGNKFSRLRSRQDSVSDLQLGVSSPRGCHRSLGVSHIIVYMSHFTPPHPPSLMFASPGWTLFLARNTKPPNVNKNLKKKGLCLRYLERTRFFSTNCARRYYSSPRLAVRWITEGFSINAVSHNRIK